MSNSKVLFKDILKDIESRQLNTKFKRTYKKLIEDAYKKVATSNNFEKNQEFENEYNKINSLMYFTITNDIDSLKNFISMHNIIAKDLRNGIIPYDLLLDAIDNNSSQKFIEFCISLYDNLNYCYNSVIVPLFVAIQNNNFIIADILQNKGADLNYKNNEGGSILILFVINEINKENLKYLHDKNINFNSSIFDEETLIKRKKSLSNFNRKIKVNPLTQLILNKHFLNCEVFKELLNYGVDTSKKYNDEIPLINAIKYKRLEYIKILIEETVKDINQIYDGKTIMNYLIDNMVDDEELFNLMFKKGAYIDYKYIKNVKNKSNILIIQNTGLIKSIIHNEIFIKKDMEEEILNITTPVIFLTTIANSNLVQIILDHGGFIDEVDEEGFTPLFHTIKRGNLKLFNILLEKYHPDITKTNNEGQTPIMYASQLNKCNENIRSTFISTLENYHANKNSNQENQNPLDWDKMKMAIKHKNLENIKIIIEKESSLNINNLYDEKTIMSHLIDNNIDNIKIYNMMFDKGAYIDFKYLVKENKDLNKLVKENAGLIQSFINNGIIAKKENNELLYIKTPVNYYTSVHNSEFVQLLLNNGASVNEQDEKGFTPIFYAIKILNIKIFDLLLNKYHADITVKNKMGQTPLQYISELEIDNKDIQNQFIFLLNNNSQTTPNLNITNSNINTNLDFNTNSNDNANSDINTSSNIQKSNVNINSVSNDLTKIELAIKKKNYKNIKVIIEKLTSENINNLNNEKTIMSHFIDNIIDDEEIYNIMFKKGAYINFKYFKYNKNKPNNLIINNIGLIKAIIHNEMLVKKDMDDQILNIKTPVIFLTSIANINLVQLLLDHGASVNESDEKGLTPIFYAIKNNNVKLFKLLLNKYHADITVKNSMGQTPLHFVSELEKCDKNTQKQFISLLNNYSQATSNSNINTNSNLNSNDSMDIELAIKEKNYKNIKAIIEKLTSENINSFYSEKTIMSHLIDNMIDDEEIYNMMFKKGAYISYYYITNSENNRLSLIEKNIGLIRSIIHNGIITMTGRSQQISHIKAPVIFFLTHTKNNIALRFLDHGASINESDERGFTPIFYTIKSKNIKLFELLLNKYHADITVKNNMGQTPLQFVSELEKCDKNIQKQFISLLNNYNQTTSDSNIKNSNINTNSNSNPNDSIMDIELAIKEKNYKNIKAIIEKLTSENINSFYSEKTIMSHLIDNMIDDEEIYNMMFKKGAYISYYYITNGEYNRLSLIEKNIGLIRSIVHNGIITMTGWEKYINHIKTPVIFFSINNRSTIVQLLLDHGASVNESDERGFTPIFYAIKNGNTKLIKLLLTKYHPDISKKNKNGKTPLEYALELNKFDTIVINTIITELKNYIKKTNTKPNNISNSKSNTNVNTNTNTIIKTDSNFNLNNKTSTNDNLKTSTSTTLNSEINNLILRSINQIKNQKQIIYKKFFEEERITDVNEYYYGKTIMSHLIDDVFDNEELFNILFRKGAYIDKIYLNDYPKKYLLIKQNKGLMKSIIRYGLIIGIPEDNKINYTRISTPVMYFIKHGKVSVAISLLESNANANEIDEEGFTPLFQAIKSCQYEAFNVLLNKFKADVTQKNKQGQTPLMYALQRDPQSIYTKELQEFDKKNGISTVASSIIKENVKTTISKEIILKTKTDDKKMKKSKSMKDIKEKLLIKEKPDDAILSQVSNNKEVINNYLNSQQFSNLYTTKDSTNNGKQIKNDSLLLLDNDNKEEDDEEKYDESMNLSYVINYLGRKYKSIDPSKIIYSDGDNINNLQKIPNNNIKKNTNVSQKVQNENEHLQEIQSNNVHPQEIQSNNVHPQEIQSNNVHLQEIQNYNECPQKIQIDNMSEKTENKNIDNNDNNIENKNFESIDHSKYSDLHYACIKESIEFITLLIESGMYDINSTCFDGSTPLLASIKFGKMKSIEELLKYKPDLTVTDNLGETPLSYLLKHPSTTNNSILSLLIPNLSLKQTYSPENLTPFYYLIKYGNKEGIKKLSQSPEFIIDELDDHGDTALIYLLKQEPINFVLIELLLYLGANVNFETSEQKVPLIYAIEQQNIDLVKLLIKYKADINYKLKNSMTPLRYTILLDNITIAKELLAIKK